MLSPASEQALDLDGPAEDRFGQLDLTVRTQTTAASTRVLRVITSGVEDLEVDHSACGGALPASIIGPSLA